VRYNGFTPLLQYDFFSSPVLTPHLLLLKHDHKRVSRKISPWAAFFLLGPGVEAATRALI